MNDQHLLNHFFTSSENRKIRKCIQCGTCSGSCPFTDYMDHAPRELFALILDDEIEEALRSDTPWYCLSCYQCMVRCPRDIPVTDVMYRLKQTAEQQGLAPATHKIPDLYEAFSRVVERNGRVTESIAMARYGIRHPVDVAAGIPLLIRFLHKRRVEFSMKRIGKRKYISRLLSRGKSEETPQ